MLIGRDLFFGGELVERFILEHAPIVRAEIFFDASIDDEKSAVDESSLTLRLLFESRYGGVVVDFQITKTSRRLHGRDRENLFLFLVELDRGVDIAVCQSIAVGQEEGVILDERQHAPKTTTRHRVQAS